MTFLKEKGKTSSGKTEFKRILFLLNADSLVIQVFFLHLRKIRRLDKKKFTHHFFLLFLNDEATLIERKGSAV